MKVVKCNYSWGGGSIQIIHEYGIHTLSDLIITSTKNTLIFLISGYFGNYLLGF